jgi:protein SCO1
MNARTLSCVGVAALGAAVMGIAGCHGNADAAGLGKSYPLRGEVLGKSAVVKEITVHQEAIPDFAPEMNAVYKVGNPAVLARLEPGDQITGKVIPQLNEVNYPLENVVVTSAPRGDVAADSLPPHQLLVGEEVPAVPMVDQDGRKIDLQTYKGKAVLITFIDSKCTEDCPIITKRFERINTLLSKDTKAYAVSHLISISIDPANDTPRVLRKYGLGYLNGDAAGFGHWGFADLTPENLRRLATAFGVVYAPSKDGDIDHTMETALIGPDGTLLQTWGGDRWDPGVVAKAVESAALKTAKL